MRFSTRNKFEGAVTKITRGAVNGIVTVDVNGTPVTATVTLDAIDDLNLRVGKEVFVIINPNDVMIGRGCHLCLSARNQFPGRILSVEEGAVNSIVRMRVLDGHTITAVVTNAAAEDLRLAEGVNALAVVNATSVLLDTDCDD